MARPLRIQIEGGRYHLTGRGNERKPIFRDDRDRKRFLDILAEFPERFGTRLHAYVLMDNHFHLVLETPEANLSRVGQWMNVTYTMRFNRRHRRSGHLLQGRFQSVLIEDQAGLQAVGRYVHLNPARVRRLGLSKHQRSVQRAGIGGQPRAQVVRERLEVLRNYRWSSYRAYAGYEKAPDWLWTEELGRLCGGRTSKERRQALREYTEEAVREGITASPWENLVGGVVLGSEDFAREMVSRVRHDKREQRAAKVLEGRVGWEAIVKAVEQEKGERWMEFRDRYGDWGRDVALWLGRTAGRMRLQELAGKVGGVDYTAVSAAVGRVGRGLAAGASYRDPVQRIKARLSNI